MHIGAKFEFLEMKILVVDDLDVTFDADVDFRNSLILESFAASTGLLPVGELLQHLPRNMMPLVEPSSESGSERNRTGPASETEKRLIENLGITNGVDGGTGRRCCGAVCCRMLADCVDPHSRQAHPLGRAAGFEISFGRCVVGARGAYVLEKLPQDDR